VARDAHHGGVSLRNHLPSNDSHPLGNKSYEVTTGPGAILPKEVMKNSGIAPCDKLGEEVLPEKPGQSILIFALDPRVRPSWGAYW